VKVIKLHGALKQNNFVMSESNKASQCAKAIKFVVSESNKTSQCVKAIKLYRE
jgi:hypothetical protein